MYHYFYLTNRNPGLSMQQFVDRWRRHAVMAAAVPEFFEPVRRYVQNDVLHDGLPGVPEATTGFDALGEFVFVSADSNMTVSLPSGWTTRAPRRSCSRRRPGSRWLSGLPRSATRRRRSRSSLAKWSSRQARDHRRLQSVGCEREPPPPDWSVAG